MSQRDRNITLPKVGNLKKLVHIACISMALISIPDRQEISAKSGFALYPATEQVWSTDQGCKLAKQAEFVLSAPTQLDRIWVKVKYTKLGSGKTAGSFFIRLTGYDHNGDLMNSQINAISSSDRRQPVIFPASWMVDPPAKIAIEYVPFNMTDKNCISEISLQEF